MKKLLWVLVAVINISLSTLGRSADPAEEESAKTPEKYRKAYIEEGIKSNVPLRYYGKVIDQKGMGIEGVKVKVKVTAFNEVFNFGNNTSDQKITLLELTTDRQGLFSIANIKGQHLGIGPLKKEGCRMEDKAYITSEYDPTRPDIFPIPDPKSPVVFHMWKTVEAEPLIQVALRYTPGGISRGYTIGKIYTIDLLKEKKTEGANAEGDFRIQFKRAAQVKPKEHYEWSLVIEVVNGGIIETDDRFLYLAPESGYKPHYELVMSSANPNWSSVTNKKFYLRSREGKVCAAIDMEIRVGWEERGTIAITYLANPAGSRNLESDPGKLIDPKRIEKVGLEKAIEEVKAKLKNGSGSGGLGKHP